MKLSDQLSCALTGYLTTKYPFDSFLKQELFTCLEANLIQELKSAYSSTSFLPDIDREQTLFTNLCGILKNHFHRIVNTPLFYTSLPNHPLTQLCLQIAQALANSDSSKIAYQYLIPTLKYCDDQFELEKLKIKQYPLFRLIYRDHGETLLPVASILQSIQLQDVNSYEQWLDPYCPWTADREQYNEKARINPEEQKRLWNHSEKTKELFNLLQKYKVCKRSNGLGRKIETLIVALRSGGQGGGQGGTDENAGVVALDGLVSFFNDWEQLARELSDHEIAFLKQLSMPYWRDKTFGDFLSIVQEDKTRDRVEDTFYCVEENACFLACLLKEHPDVFYDTETRDFDQHFKQVQASLDDDEGLEQIPWQRAKLSLLLEYFKIDLYKLIPQCTEPDGELLTELCFENTQSSDSVKLLDRLLSLNFSEQPQAISHQAYVLGLLYSQNTTLCLTHTQLISILPKFKESFLLQDFMHYYANNHNNLINFLRLLADDHLAQSIRVVLQQDVTYYAALITNVVTSEIIPGNEMVDILNALAQSDSLKPIASELRDTWEKQLIQALEADHDVEKQHQAFKKARIQPELLQNCELATFKKLLSILQSQIDQKEVLACYGRTFSHNHNNLINFLCLLTDDHLAQSIRVVLQQDIAYYAALITDAVPSEMIPGEAARRKEPEIAQESSVGSTPFFNNGTRSDQATNEPPPRRSSYSSIGGDVD